MVVHDGEEQALERIVTRNSDEAGETAATGAEAAEDSAERAKRWKQVGIGVGSAALLAALLYVNQKKPKGK